MLRRLSLKDFVIVDTLELEFGAGFSVLTGETGAGKSILIDALQLALGARAEGGVVREGCARSEIAAEFDSPASLAGWLDEAGFAVDETLLLRRVVDAQGKSRAFVNGSAATLTQLREVADHLIDIHGQHAWQSLTRPAAVRALLDDQAGIDATPVATAHASWAQATAALASARERQGELDTERERLAWQLAEVERLSPSDDEWQAITAEHGRLSHAQALMSASQQALEDVSEGELNALKIVSRAAAALREVADYDAALAPVIEALDGAELQLQDAAHSLSSYLNRADLDPQRLSELDERMSAWMSLARRFRRSPEDLATLWGEWKSALAALDAAADLAGLQKRVDDALARWRMEARRVSARRAAAAPLMAGRITEAMQQLGMAGGRFDVALVAQESPQSYGAETVEFLVAGHAGSTPRPLAKVASGGELSRLALAIAVTAAQSSVAASEADPTRVASTSVGTLIFDEIDAGVGGTVADSVGRLMKRLGRHVQVMAVTHLPQVAACGDHHFVVAKRSVGGNTTSQVTPLAGEARVAEVARMLGGERSSGTSLAHAQELIAQAVAVDGGAPAPRGRPGAR
ncbi:DNA repair protein RecN [Scleromatobacter humisilvae]|uniref:DNA repair protein RecN n=1 Tax=Scleromatobacter humisilvae TaxID=2897159 RepID=A0A9X1YMJ1_9BURK|nr:DNA repair protein RecN [Scleromatobacter humisilvae]MCK9688913.1 DNA repair protein RecN [Scleromatobacter humisilvae]